MRYFWLSLKAIFIKDIVTELRAKQVLPTMIVLGMLIVWVLRMASEAVLQSEAVIGPVEDQSIFLAVGGPEQHQSLGPHFCSVNGHHGGLRRRNIRHARAVGKRGLDPAAAIAEVPVQ